MVNKSPQSEKNGFVPPEVIKKQAASGFVPPEVKKKGQGEPTASPSISGGGDSSLGSQTVPSEPEILVSSDVPDWVTLNPQEAKTAPLDQLEESLQYWADKYKGDLPINSERGRQFSEMVESYKERVATSGDVKKQMALFSGQAFYDYKDKLVDKGIATKEELQGLSPDEVYQLVGSRAMDAPKGALTGGALEESMGIQSIPDNSIRESGEETGGLGRMATEESSSTSVGIYQPSVKDIKSSEANYAEREYKNILKNKFLETIPENERTPEKIAELEDEIMFKTGVKLNLDPNDNSQFGTDKSVGVLGNVIEKSIVLGQTLLSMEAALQSNIVELFGGDDNSIIFTGSKLTTPALMKQKAKQLDRYITQYEDNTYQALKKGRFQEALDLSVNQFVQSSPYMVVMAASPNPATAYTLMTAMSANTHYDAVKKEEWFKKLSPAEKFGNVFTTSVMEAGGEIFGARALGRTVKNLVKPAFKEGATITLKEYAKQAAKTYGVNFKEEGLGEMITGLTQDITERISKGELDDMTAADLLNTAIENFVAGVSGATISTGGGSVVGGVLLTPAFIANSSKRKKLAKILGESKSPTERTLIIEQVEELNRELKSVIENQQQMLKELPDSESKTYLEALRKFNKNRLNFRRLQADGLQDSETAKRLKDQMQEDLNTMQEIEDKYQPAEGVTEKLTGVQSSLLKDAEDLADNDVKVYNFETLEEIPESLRGMAKEIPASKADVKVGFFGKTKEVEVRKPYFQLTVSGRDLRDAIQPQEQVAEQVAEQEKVDSEQEVESKKADIERRRQEELEKPYRTFNDGSGTMVTVTTETTEKEGIKKTKFKTQTTNRKGEPRTQNDKGYNTFEEAVENLGIDLQSEENQTALELVETLKESLGKETLPARVVEIRESTDKSSPFYGSRTATVIVGSEKIEFRLKNNAEPSAQSTQQQEVEVEEQVTEKQEDTDAIQEQQTTQIPSEPEAETIQEVEEEVRGEQEGEETTTQEQRKERVDSIVKDVVDKTKKRNVGEDTNPQVLQENAISYLQGSKFYQEATDTERENAVREVNQQLGINIKRPPSVKRILGQPSPKRVEMTDKALVRQRLQDMSKAAREGYRQRASEVKDFAERIKETVKEIPKGVLNTTQLSQITKAAAGVQTPSQMRNFEKVASKVINDAEYAQKLSDAYKTRSKVEIGKAAPSNIQSAFKRFANINPSRVQDLDSYERIAEGLLAYKGTPRRTANERGVEVTEKEGMLPISEINEYIDKQNSLKESDLRDSLLEDNKELVEAGVLDEELTLKEVEEILDAINSDEPSPVFEGDDGQRKKEGFKRILIDYQRILKGITQPDLNKWDKQGKEALENVNVDELSDRYLSMLYTMINNAIVNNAYNGTQIINSQYKIQKEMPVLKAERSKAARETGSISAGITNIPSLLRAVKGRSEYASSFQEKTGLFDIFTGKTSSEVEQNKAADELKKIIGDKFNQLEKQVFLSMYSTLLTGGRDNFDYFKGKIREMIDNDLKSNDKNIKKEAEIAIAVYQDKIEGAKSIRQIKISATEKKVVDFFVDLFAGIKEDFKATSENVYNIEFVDQTEFYIPLMWRRRKKSEQAAIGDSFYYQQKPSPKKDGSLNKRTFKVDPKSQTIEYNFINAALNKYGQQLMDIKTAQGIYDFNAFLEHPDAIDVMGSENNYNVIRGRVKKYVDNYKEYMVATNTQRAAFDLLRYSARLGSRLVLGGVSQVAKQSIPVFGRSFFVLGKNANLLNKSINMYFSKKDVVDKLLENYTIQQRGFLKQEFKNVDRKIPRTTKERRKSQLRKYAEFTDEAVEKLSMQPLEFADVTTAKTTWLAFYMQNLKVQQGLDVDNMSVEEILKPNKQAAAYAEQMVAETQVPSDVDQNGLYLIPKDEILHVARQMLFPFVTFRATQSYSIINSAYGLKDKKERLKSARELAGVAAENFMFEAISKGYYIATIMGAGAIASMMGIDFEEDDEEKKQEKYKNWVTQTVAATVSNINPLYGINGGFDSFQIGLLNKFYFYVVMDDEERGEFINKSELNKAKSDKQIDLVMEKGYNNWEKKGQTPMRDFSAGKEAWYDKMGQTGMAFGAFAELKKTVDMSDDEVYEYVNKWNAINTEEFTDGEKDLLMLSAVMQASNFLVPKEISDVGKRIRSKVQYGERKKPKSQTRTPDKLTRSIPKKLDRDGGGSGKLQRSTPKKLDR